MGTAFDMRFDRVKQPPSGGAKTRLNPRAAGFGAIAIFASAVGIDCGIWYSAYLSSLALPVALALHVFIVAIAGKAMAYAPSTDRTLQGIGISGLLFCGPIAGIGTLLIVPLVNQFGGHSDVLARWYKLLSSPTESDAATRLYHNLAMGRAVRPGAFPVPSFSQVLKFGNLREQQSVLGLIGLKYRPEYRSALQLGLTSPEASIRVQSAAVFAKLREHYKAGLKRGLSRADAALDREHQTAAAGDLLTILESGFLDQTETRRAYSAVRQLMRQIGEQWSGNFETELLVCRLLAVEGNHQAICTRIRPRLEEAPAPLRHLFQRSMRTLGRSVDFGDATVNARRSRDGHARTLNLGHAQKC